MDSNTNDRVSQDNDSRDARKPVPGFPTRSHTNRPVQLKKLEILDLRRRGI